MTPLEWQLRTLADKVARLRTAISSFIESGEEVPVATIDEYREAVGRYTALSSQVIAVQRETGLRVVNPDRLVATAAGTRAA